MTYYVSRTGVCFEEPDRSQTNDKLALLASHQLCGLIATLLELRGAYPIDFRTAVLRAARALLQMLEQTMGSGVCRD